MTGFKKWFSKYSELSHSLNEGSNLDAVQEEEFSDENNKSQDQINMTNILENQKRKKGNEGKDVDKVQNLKQSKFTNEPYVGL